MTAIRDQIHAIIYGDFPGEGYDFGISDSSNGTIEVVEREAEYSAGNSMLMASTFESVFAKTGYFITAVDTGIYNGKNFIRTYLHNSKRFHYVDKGGTEWKDTPYRAQCPKCKDKTSFSMMRYDPNDLRRNVCPKCKHEGNVQDFWESAKGK